MIATPARRKPHNPITQILDRIVETERVEAERRAEQAVSRKGREKEGGPAYPHADQGPLSGDEPFLVG